MDEPVEVVGAKAAVLTPSFVLLVCGQGISALGDQFFQVALPVTVLGGGDVLLLGDVLAFYGVFRLLGLVVGGQLADRFSPRRTMLVADLVRAVAVAAIAVAFGISGLNVPVLAAAAAVLGVCGGVFLPADFSIVADVVAPSNVRVANSVNFAVIQGVTLGGPVLAGLALVRFGVGPALAVDAASYLVSAATLWFVRTPASSTTEPTRRREGVLVLLRRLPFLRLIVLMATLASLGFGGVLSVGLPALVNGTSSSLAVGYGFVLGALGLGALLGSLLAGAVRPPKNPVRVAGLLALAQAGLLGVAGAVPATWLLAALFLGVGVANSTGNVLLMTFVQVTTPAEFRGRISGVLLLASFGLFPVSAFLAARLAQGAGASAVFFVGAALVAVAALVGQFAIRRPPGRTSSSQGR